MRIALPALLCATAAFTLAAGDAARPSPAFSILRVGQPAPPPLRLSQYRGKVVALAFIHTTCTHCQDLTAVLKPIAKDYAPRGVQFLECAFNENVQNLLPEFIQRFQPPFPVGWNNNLAVMSYLQHSIIDQRPFYVPHMVFLDRQGVIRGDYPGEDQFFRNPDANIRVELDRLLKPAAAKKAPPAKK